MADLKSNLDKIRRQFGESIVANLEPTPRPVPVVSTGVGALDLALGCGGFPRGRLTTLFGPESGGKTTLSLWSMGRVIADGGVGAFLDIEQGGSEAYLYACLEGAGIPVEKAVAEEKLVVLRPNTAEETATIAKTLLPIVDLMVLDSISAMVTQAELDAESGSVMVGISARFQTSEFKKINSALGTTGCALVVISQIRANISPFGSSETTTEPHILRHLASVRMRISKDKGVVKDSGRPVIQAAKVSIHKNKVGLPWGEAGFDIILGQGISPYRDAFELGVELGVIRRAGSVYRYPPDDYKMNVSGVRAGVRELTQNQELLEEIQAANEKRLAELRGAVPVG